MSGFEHTQSAHHRSAFYAFPWYVRAMPPRCCGDGCDRTACDSAFCNLLGHHGNTERTPPWCDRGLIAQLIRAFVFATQILQSLYFLNPKFQASGHHLWLYSPVCVGLGRKPRRPVFSQRGSYKRYVSMMLKPMLLLTMCRSVIHWSGNFLSGTLGGYCDDRCCKILAAIVDKSEKH